MSLLEHVTRSGEALVRAQTVTDAQLRTGTEQEFSEAINWERACGLAHRVALFYRTQADTRAVRAGRQT